MPFLRRVLLAALFAGVLSGGFAALLHQIATVPLILEAEQYERAAGHAAENAVSHAAPANSAATAGHHEHDAAWEPETRLERVIFTFAADLLAGIGFALLLAAGMALRGDEVAWREGLFWGLAGFLAVTVAPGLGLPPEVPGTEAAALLSRQLWWVATAGMTASALALLAFTRQKLIAAAAVALLVLPHLYGAPVPDHEAAVAPASLARQFVVTATVASFLFWAALGAATGYFYDRFGRRAV
ncbi:MAG: CbtA family protein [Alphaproteobacteria bacterium]